MLFNYHVKEMFSTVCFFFQTKNKNGKKKRKKRTARRQCEDHTALTAIGTVTYTVHSKRLTVPRKQRRLS